MEELFNTFDVRVILDFIKETAFIVRYNVVTLFYSSYVAFILSNF